jgi:hypothetical protein
MPGPVAAKALTFPSLVKEPAKVQKVPDMGKAVVDKLRLYEARLGIAKIKPLSRGDLVKMREFIAVWKQKGKSALSKEIWERVFALMQKIHPFIELRLGPLPTLFKEAPKAKAKSLPLFPQEAKPKDKVQAFWDKIKSSAAATELLRKVEKILKDLPGQPEIKLRFVPPKETLFGAHYLFSESTIEISSSEPEIKQLACFLFELCNAYHTREFLAAEAKIKKGQYKSAVQYAVEFERIELESIKLYTATIHECIKKDKWDPRLDEYGALLQKPWGKFEGYWRHQLQTGHARSYMLDYAGAKKNLSS